MSAARFDTLTAEEKVILRVGCHAIFRLRGIWTLLEALNLNILLTCLCRC